MDRDVAPRVRALKALAHPARLTMVEALADGERCVCDLQTLVGSDISTVSRHLKTLVHAGLLASRREGQKVFYKLETPCIVDFVACIGAVLRGEPCRMLAGNSRDER